MLRKVILATLLLLMTTLFMAGCLNEGGNDVDTVNNQLPERVDMSFDDIVNLMSMSKDEVLDWCGENYIRVPSNGIKIEKYTDRNNLINIYFSAIVDPNKIDSIEFTDCADINGIRIGEVYVELAELLPDNYTDFDLYGGAPNKWSKNYTFTFDDFFVIIEQESFDSEIYAANEIIGIKVVRSIPLENMKRMIDMSEEDLICNYGGEYGETSDYRFGFKEYIYSNSFLGALLILQEYPDGARHNQIRASNWNNSRLTIDGAHVGMNINDILNNFGKPDYHGPFPPGDDDFLVGELLVYGIDGGQVCFYAYEDGGECKRIVYRDWIGDNRPQSFRLYD